MLRRREAVLGLMGAGLTATLAPGGAAVAATRTVQVGQAAPDFQVTTFDLKTYDLAALRGQVILLNYWATWCAPCRAEMLVMDTYVRSHPTRAKDLRIFAVTTESSAPNYKLKPLADVLAFPLAKRLHGKGYGLIDGKLPTSFVIDRAGVVRHAAPGSFETEDFARLITPLLAEAPPSALTGSAPA